MDFKLILCCCYIKKYYLSISDLLESLLNKLDFTWLFSFANISLISNEKKNSFHIVESNNKWNILLFQSNFCDN